LFYIINNIIQSFLDNQEADVVTNYFKKKEIIKKILLSLRLTEEIQAFKSIVKLN
jgi:hypothetical protein